MSRILKGNVRSLVTTLGIHLMMALGVLAPRPAEAACEVHQNTVNHYDGTCRTLGAASGVVGVIGLLVFGPFGGLLGGGPAIAAKVECDKKEEAERALTACLAVAAVYAERDRIEAEKEKKAAQEALDRQNALNQKVAEATAAFSQKVEETNSEMTTKSEAFMSLLEDLGVLATEEGQEAVNEANIGLAEERDERVRQLQKALDEEVTQLKQQ